MLILHLKDTSSVNSNSLIIICHFCCFKLSYSVGAVVYFDAKTDHILEYLAFGGQCSIRFQYREKQACEKQHQKFMSNTHFYATKMCNVI